MWRSNMFTQFSSPWLKSGFSFGPERKTNVCLWNCRCEGENTQGKEALEETQKQPGRCVPCSGRPGSPLCWTASTWGPAAPLSGTGSSLCESARCWCTAHLSEWGWEGDTASVSTSWISRRLLTCYGDDTFMYCTAVLRASTAFCG